MKKLRKLLRKATTADQYDRILANACHAKKYVKKGTLPKRPTKGSVLEEYRGL
jgi:hypothetical protein